VYRRAAMELTPELLLRAYAAGAFPMARSRASKEVAFFSPDPRAVLPLRPDRGDGRGGFKVRRSLAKRVRNGPFEVTSDRAFERVIDACAQPRAYAEDTWINRPIREAFLALHAAGIAHSVEAWADGDLVGGLYGAAIGGAFFGESMFSAVRDASQVCLVRLVERLRVRGFALLDVQFTNPHLEQFGVQEIPREAYLERLQRAIATDATWGDDGVWAGGQRLT